ncbi:MULTISPECIES: hypothetical protein [unclassified Oceanispirochaeta]|uniref:hypothetical protein n=1 Tax=unclassified Oceanispirochaeta TaxID=2635722 RepID=UPI001313E660|nr:MULTISPECIES: hypothetical protein [unclassified Oceanispirochaeta]MBF9018826.1 hypothetical protein [Oceanispirochaeta sp. M2]NPD75295.1 hypothetical protein [Oceanispirochaeta sp. M1]
MVADTLRAHLLEMKGYRVDIFDFVSSRYTDKNVMIRAKKNGRSVPESLLEDYAKSS